MFFYNLPMQNVLQNITEAYKKPMKTSNVPIKILSSFWSTQLTRYKEKRTEKGRIFCEQILRAGF